MTVALNIVSAISSSAKRMVYKRWVFIALMLASPWQTRWFSDAGLLAGYPWEQGRVSVYASWFLLAALAGLSAWQKRIVWRKPKLQEVLFLAALLVPALLSSEPRASFSWLLLVSFAVLFVWVIRREQISARNLAFWFAVSLMPHALLGIAQFAFQSGFENKWLGLSLLDPAIKGTAVILSDNARYLRAYGGFPHPNIFGGYLACSLLLITCVWSDFCKKRKKLLFLIVPSLSIALALTASRSAWLCLFLGLVVFCFLQIKRRFILCVPLAWLLVPFMAALVAFPFLVRPISPVMANVEQKSVNERVVALRQVPAIWINYPLVGTGEGALMPALIQQKLEPLLPHVVPVMALLELGLLGLGFLLSSLWMLLRDYLKKIKNQPLAYSVFWSLIAALTPILVLDHYLWSYWPGLILIGILVVFLTHEPGSAFAKIP